MCLCCGISKKLHRSATRNAENQAGPQTKEGPLSQISEMSISEMSIDANVKQKLLSMLAANLTLALKRKQVLYISGCSDAVKFV